jgi:hypothetical protein
MLDAAMDEAWSAADEPRSRCSLAADRLPQVDDPCLRLTAADARARAVVEAKAMRMDALRHQTAVKEWRAHIAQCRRLDRAAARVIPLLERGACHGECMTVVQKMRREAERLASFEPSFELDSESVSAELREECEQTSCEVCP